ncbi:MAG TPA: hypothetical protein VN702_24135 [Acetobacteraceae bacterium]|nr:hypothetical protein [Acetobacteraceae bacterium]
MRSILLVGTALIGLSASAAFAAVPASSAPNATAPAMSSDIEQGSAVAGANFGGSTDRYMPAEKVAPAPAFIAPKPTRVDPPDLFQNSWGAGGSG